MAIAATHPISLQLAQADPELDLHNQHFPLLLLRWTGQAKPADLLRLIRGLDVAQTRAREDGVSLVLICDAREASVPDPLIREMLGDWLGDSSSSPRPSMVGFMVTNEPLVRGVITALKWATGRGRRLSFVASLEEASEGARVHLLATGCPIPAVLAV